MKRLLSLVLAAALVISSISFSAFATETESERDILIARACEVFPEFSEKITASADEFTQQSRTVTKKPVYTETRQVSDREYITYTEHSDGIVLLSDIYFEYTTNEIGHEISGANTTVTVTITALCNYISGYFKLSNVQYTISRSGYDQIDSAGSMSYGGNASLHTAYSPIWYETASQKAQISYRIKWFLGPDPGDYLNSILTLEVGNNGAGITHIEN